MKSKRTLVASSWLIGTSALAIMTVLGTSAVYAQDNESIETVTVTGFRASLEKALDMKREALDASDSIMAEDIAKFPDMNVSESLQRIPGVGITRESGEGRQITVRGLGSQFTRVRINGVEAMATVGSQDVSTSGGGTNRGRGFDFNIFAADLFKQLTVHKTASADLEEGSLGATVDLHTAHPFDFSGFTLTTSAQAGYQALAGSTNPRFAALISNTYMGGRLGFLVSATYGSTNTLEEGTSSVRWQSDLNTGTSASASYRFYSVCTDAGVTCATSGTDFTAANAAFRPRFPRYDVVSTHSKRLGLTGSVQWQPDDDTLFTLDALYADFAQVRNEYYIEANSLSSAAQVASTNVRVKNAYGSYVDSDDGLTYYYSSLSANNIQLINYDSSDLGKKTGLTSTGVSTYTLERAEMVGVGLRNEHRLDHLDTRFMQATLDGSHIFSEEFKMHMLLGWTESHHRNPLQATLAADYGCFQTTACSGTAGSAGGAGTTTDPVTYDYSYGDMPLLNFGNVDVTSTSGWFLANVRMREEYAFNSFRSAMIDGEFKPQEGLTLVAGASVRNYGYGTMEKKRSSGVSGATSEVTTIPTADRSVDLSTYATQIGLSGIDAPAGSDTTWFTLNFDKAGTALGIWDRDTYPVTMDPGYANTGSVRENDYSGWVQAAWDSELFDMPFRGDVGVRYILTESESLGYSLINSVMTAVEGHHVYHDFLPALNMTIDPTEDLVVRFNASYTMSRPNMTSMLPTGTVSVAGSNYTASVGNPALNPVRSKNLDLSFEWYYGKGSMLSIAGFWKHIDTFIQSVQSTGTAANNPFGLDLSAFVSACGGTGSDWGTTTASGCGESTAWTYTATVNAKGAPLYGTEINWQQQLDFLPAPFNNMGILANYTYVQAQQSYYNSDGSLIMKDDLVNLSRNSYNATIYYDDSTFQARITAAYRGKYLFNSNVASNNQNYGIYSKATLNVDASVSYKLDDSLMFTVDAMNLTNQASNIIADKYAERSYQYHETGRVFYFGVKYTY